MGFLNRNPDVFRNMKLILADIGNRERARRKTPHRSQTCRAEVEMVLKYDIMNPRTSPR